LKKAERISFDEIRIGDRIRVTYVEGQANAWYTSAATDNSVTRTIAATAQHPAMDKVWLNEGGHPIAHRDWKDMRIFRLDKV
jgi:hypothetical protein